MSGMGERESRPVNRDIASPFVVGGPCGVRVRTRLRVSADDAAVLWQVGAWLGGLGWPGFGCPLPAGAARRAGSREVARGA
jgi:hypothetical protein